MLTGCRGLRQSEVGRLSTPPSLQWLRYHQAEIDVNLFRGRQRCVLNYDKRPCNWARQGQVVTIPSKVVTVTLLRVN